MLNKDFENKLKPIRIESVTIPKPNKKKLTSQQNMLLLKKFAHQILNVKILN
jgi:hypothetical protein